MKVNIIILLCILSLLTVSLTAQTMSIEDRRNKANEILNQSKKAIYKKSNKINVKSIFLKDGGTTAVESITKVDGFGQPQTVKFQRNIEENISLLSTNKINFTTFNFNPDVSPAENYTKTKDTLNGETASRETEIISNGKVVDFMTLPKVPNMPESVKKQLQDDIDKKTKTTKEEIFTATSNRIFPLLLDMDWINNKSLLFVGKADAGDAKADILEIERDSGRHTQFFFDEKSHLLLMMIDEVSKSGISYKLTMYFSDYQLADGLMVAKKINLEIETSEEKPLEMGGKTLKATNTSKTTKEIIIKEIKINPKFKPEIFETKASK